MKGSGVLQQRVEQLLQAIPVLPTAPDADHFYGDIRTALETTGKIIGGNDPLIAAMRSQRMQYW